MSTALGWSTRSTQARASAGDLPNATCRATSRGSRTASSVTTCQTASSRARTARPRVGVQQQVVALGHHQAGRRRHRDRARERLLEVALEHRRHHHVVRARRAAGPAARRTPTRRRSPARPCGPAARAGPARRRRGGSRPSAPPRRRSAAARNAASVDLPAPGDAGDPEQEPTAGRGQQPGRQLARARVRRGTAGPRPRRSDADPRGRRVVHRPQRHLDRVPDAGDVDLPGAGRQPVRR